ncbi:MAG TPA: CPCC family cysteine-rich protein, partial [Candidatus Elarobacter sp.]
DICDLCWWEDDGQDDPNADHVAGGPNSDYSLTEARHNFAIHQTQYRLSDKRFPRRAKVAADRARVIAAYDALLPDVHPWSFITALPRIDELHEALREREFGKRRVRRWRAAGADERRGADREWEIWRTLAAATLPAWRRGWEQPSISSHRAQTFKAVVVRVDEGLAKRLGRDALVLTHRGSDYCSWSRGEHGVWMTSQSVEPQLHLMFEPYLAERPDRFVGLTDVTAAVDQVVEHIADFFAVPAMEA